MADMKTFSGLTKQNLVIPAYSMQSVFFDTVSPNYYRVQNQGEGTLYCGTSHHPTRKQHDFIVPPESIKVYAEPFEKNVLYIFNPSGSEIPVTLLTFKADFDPLALVMSDLSFDLSGTTVETSTLISGFNSPLPSGTNKIGGVDVLNGKDYTNVLSYIENHLSTLKTNQKDYTANLASILSALNTDLYGTKLDSIITALGTGIYDAKLDAIISALGTGIYNTKLDNILAAIGNISGGGSGGGGSEVFSAVQMMQGAATTSSTQINESGIVTIHFLTNDGENQITVYFGGIPIFLKGGESIQDFKFNGSVSVGSGATFRAMVSVG